MKGGILMLGFWTSHADYQQFVIHNLKTVDSESVFEYKDVIPKLFILNLDKLKHTIAPLYSSTGRPALHQPEIFRSFILMNELGFKLDNWIPKLKNSFVLRTIVGVDRDSVPSVSSHYDFINRLIDIDENPRVKIKKPKPTKKIGKNKKLPNKHPNIVQRLVNKIICGRSFSNRPEKYLQRIFADVCVSASIDLGIIPASLDIAGDGTCIKTAASHYGKSTCNCKKNGIFNCNCPRKFSDPNARWGWDSSKESYFYGYMGYFLSTYNKDLKVDLPLYLRIVEANRNDSVSAVVALQEFRELYPNLKVDSFLSDAASDNYATYELLHRWDINAVIALNETNKGNFKYPPTLSIDKNGAPVCMCNQSMVNWGFNKDRCRIKYRCPLACGKIDSCPCKAQCSQSEYGRTVYIKPEWDLRLFTRIPRGTTAWKEKFNQRTCAERVNNRILNDYGVEKNYKTKKRISFFTMIAGFNIHLDAQLKYLTLHNKLGFEALLK